MTPFWCDGASDWVAEQIEGCERGFAACRALAVMDRDGKICAGVVFHDWNPERGVIELSVAATNRRWLTKPVANEAMAYAFSIARMAVATISEKNKPARHLWRGLGGTEHLIPDMWAPGVACSLTTLTQDQWQASRLYEPKRGGI